MKNCCSDELAKTTDYEVVKIKKTSKVCPMCEDFSKGQLEKQVPIAILSCEGACLRGEVSRRVANQICFESAPEKTSRICLGGAFTKDTGQRNLVRNSQRTIVLEGCFIECASRMMEGVLEDFNPEKIMVDRFYDFDRNLFSVNQVSEEEIKTFVQTATSKILEKIQL